MKKQEMSVEARREHEKETVGTMIKIYCHGNHHTKGNQLCDQCRELKEYTGLRTEKCPFMETKTFCSACKVHCYSGEKKEQIRAVMRYSGPRMLFVSPGLTLKHGIVTLQQKRIEKERKHER